MSVCSSNIKTGNKVSNLPPHHMRSSRATAFIAYNYSAIATVLTAWAGQRGREGGHCGGGGVCMGAIKKLIQTDNDVANVAGIHPSQADKVKLS